MFYSDPPLLSVCLITYNHEKYIRDALDGIFMQKVNFPVEVIIADDCSTDKTREIILEFEEKHPDIIKLIFQKVNKGPAENWRDLISAPKGKYVAYFEGDDYWTDQNKLQKQVDFLEASPDFSICFHAVEEVSNKTKNHKILGHIGEEREYTIEDLAKQNFIHTPSVVFRKVLNELPSWFNQSPAGDYPLHMLNSRHGKIKYFPEKMAAYRVGSGLWSTQSYQTQIIKWFFVLKFLIKEFSDLPKVQQNLLNHLLGVFLNFKKICVEKSEFTLLNKHTIKVLSEIPEFVPIWYEKEYLTIINQNQQLEIEKVRQKRNKVFKLLSIIKKKWKTS